MLETIQHTTSSLGKTAWNLPEMDRITLQSGDVSLYGLESAIVQAIVKDSGGVSAALALETACEVGAHFGLRQEQTMISISTLLGQGVLIYEKNALRLRQVTDENDFSLSETTGRRLRQFGLSPSQVRALKKAYARENSDEPTEADFLQYVIRQTQKEMTPIEKAWEPPTSIVHKLQMDGVSDDFIQTGLSLFRERYNAHKGGGDIEKNFLRFIRAAWQKQKKPIPQAWLPTTHTNRKLIACGMSQKEVMEKIIEFRMWATETGKLSTNWDAELERHVLFSQNDRRQATSP